MTVAPGSVIAELGLRVNAARASRVRGRAIVLPEVCEPKTGALRTSVLATWADVVTGVAAIKVTAPRIPLTLDLETHVINVARAGAELLVETNIVKVGRTVTLCEARFSDAGSEPGIIEVPRLADGLNATGAIQGGLVAFAAEEAALSRADRPTLIRALTIRYLRPFSTGPARAVATADDWLSRIELTDVGAGKLSAIATARTEAMSAV